MPGLMGSPGKPGIVGPPGPQGNAGQPGIKGDVEMLDLWDLPDFKALLVTKGL